MIVGIVSIETKHDITQEMVDDLLCAALEGGITYWCNRVEAWYNGSSGLPPDAIYASDALTRGGWLVLHDSEEGETHALTLNSFVEGIAIYCNRHSTSPSEMYEDHDAETADHILQYTLFDDIIYG